MTERFIRQILGLVLLLLASRSEARELSLPWQQAGLTEAQAAAHLLDRFAFGARPGDIDQILELGLESWLVAQLATAMDDASLDRRLEEFRSLQTPTAQVASLYPSRPRVLREAEQAGIIDREQLPDPADRSSRSASESRADRETFGNVRDFAIDQGYRSQRELIGELLSQKLLRAAQSNNQLSEVLTDFWFNHFNVSLTDTDSRVFVSTYERDAIRPHVLGNFRTMLEATAKHPAMLLYLDNVRSVAEPGQRTTATVPSRAGRFGNGSRGRRRPAQPDTADRQRQGPQGLNENYARELMELHTLGVDGGYDQQDVIEVARAFTGWATIPPGRMNSQMQRRIDRARSSGRGFVIEDTFIFRADAHDAEKKTILGTKYPAGRGIEDGMQVLDQLASHPSTARHLATKLATRFVSDLPPPALIDRLAARFESSEGDLRDQIVVIAESPEFWSSEARAAKIKSPFEVAVSAIRSLDAEIFEPRELLEWIARMGQPLYSYQAPTGYPDRASAWVNTGSLLNRMNFGLQLSTGRIRGVRFDLAALDEGREPESVQAGLETYLGLLLPERDTAAAAQRLQAVVAAPDLADRVAAAAPLTETSSTGWSSEPIDEWDPLFAQQNRRGRQRRHRELPPATIDTSPLAHIVGVILGSPEFQRR